MCGRGGAARLWAILRRIAAVMLLVWQGAPCRAQEAAADEPLSDELLAATGPAADTPRHVARPKEARRRVVARRRRSGADDDLRRIYLDAHGVAAGPTDAPETAFLPFLGWLAAPPTLLDGPAAVPFAGVPSPAALLAEPACVEAAGLYRYLLRRLDGVLERLQDAEVDRLAADGRLRFLDDADSVRRRERPGSFADARFALRFPDYWRDHPRYVEQPEVRTVGERIELWRGLGVVITSDLRIAPSGGAAHRLHAESRPPRRVRPAPKLGLEAEGPSVLREEALPDAPGTRWRGRGRIGVGAGRLTFGCDFEVGIPVGGRLNPVVVFEADADPLRDEARVGLFLRVASL